MSVMHFIIQHATTLKMHLVVTDVQREDTFDLVMHVNYTNYYNKNEGETKTYIVCMYACMEKMHK